MKYKKILAIISIVVFLSCVFCIPSLAYTVTLDSDGWYSVTRTDLVYISIGGNERSWVNVPIPWATAFVINNNNELSSFIQIDTKADDYDSDIHIPNGYHFRYSLSAWWSVDGSVIDIDSLDAVLMFYDSDKNLIMYDAKVTYDSDNRWVTNVSFRNTSGKDLYLDGLQLLYNEPFVVGKTYWFNLKSLRYKILDDQSYVTNGWESKPKPPAQQEQVDEVGDLEDQIMGSVSGGDQDVGTVFNSAISQFSTFLPALAVIGRVFSGFVDIPLVSALLHISLSLGVCAFTLNLTSFIASSIGRHEQRAAKAKSAKSASKSG